MWRSRWKEREEAPRSLVGRLSISMFRKIAKEGKRERPLVRDSIRFFEAAYVRESPNLVIQYVLYSIPLIMYARAIAR